VSAKADIYHLFSLMECILNNIDDGQISVMTSFRKKISYTFVFTRLGHEIVQYDQIPLRYVQVISVVDLVGNAFIELDSRHRPRHIKIRWLPLTITPNDTFCSFSKRVFTHTVLPLWVHPATTHLNGCCKTADPLVAMRMLSVGF
jgi:hypothetical protein